MASQSWNNKGLLEFANGTSFNNPSEKPRYFDEKTGFLQLVPGADTGFDGHGLRYLLWGLVDTGGSRKDEVYRALVDGPTVDCWGSYNEAYTATGVRNDHDLRSLETGVNLSALAKYWGLGR